MNGSCKQFNNKKKVSIITLSGCGWCEKFVGLRQQFHCVAPGLKCADAPTLKRLGNEANFRNICDLYVKRLKVDYIVHRDPSDLDFIHTELRPSTR